MWGADLFRIEGRDLVVERYGKRAAGTDKLVVDYLSDEVARSEVLPDHSPFFIKGVVFLLAGRCALKLASSPPACGRFGGTGGGVFKQGPLLGHLPAFFQRPGSFNRDFKQFHFLML